MTALRLVLASASPRRRELLAALGLTFEIRPADIDETARPGEAAAELVLRLARRDKAVAVGRAGELTLGADSVVDLDSRILGKPGDPDEATAMLRSLSGRTHIVHTGIAFYLDPGHRDSGDGSPRTVSTVVTTEVTFADLSDAELAWYVRTGDPLDKAGGYGLQSYGGRLVRSIVGSASNVIGLPVAESVDLAASLGVDLAQFRDGA